MHLYYISFQKKSKCFFLVSRVTREKNKKISAKKIFHKKNYCRVRWARSGCYFNFERKYLSPLHAARARNNHLAELLAVYQEVSLTNGNVSDRFRYSLAYHFIGKGSKSAKKYPEISHKSAILSSWHSDIWNLLYKEGGRLALVLREFRSTLSRQSLQRKQVIWKQ